MAQGVYRTADLRLYRVHHCTLLSCLSLLSKFSYSKGALLLFCGGAVVETASPRNKHAKDLNADRDPSKVDAIDSNSTPYSKMGAWQKRKYIQREGNQT